MTVVSLKAEQSHSDGAVKVEFSDGSTVLLSVDYVPEGYTSSAVWQSGGELNQADEEIFRFAASCYRAEKAALRLVSRAEQNSLGLTAKLERRGYERAVVIAVVSCLVNKNLLDDRRYAEFWLRSRLTYGNIKSPRWMRVSLGKRGIDRSSSVKALEEVLDPETEYALLLKFIEKNKATEMEKAVSQRIRLKREGFSSAVIERYFDS